MWFGWGGTLFINKKNSEKAKHPQICQSLVVTWAKPNFITTLVSPSPTNTWMRFLDFFRAGAGQGHGEVLPQHCHPALGGRWATVWGECAVTRCIQLQWAVAAPWWCPLRRTAPTQVSPWRWGPLGNSRTPGRSGSWGGGGARVRLMDDRVPKTIPEAPVLSSRVRWFGYFHRIGPLGRFGLVVAMSVCLSVCVSPPHAIFLKCWCQKGSDVECCYSLILINSWERNHHYLLLFNYYIMYLILC